MKVFSWTRGGNRESGIYGLLIFDGMQENIRFTRQTGFNRKDCPDLYKLLNQAQYPARTGFPASMPIADR